MRFGHGCYERLQSKFEQVKSALNSNDEVKLRTIYDDLACRFVEWFGAESFIQDGMQRKELGLVLL